MTDEQQRESPGAETPSKPPSVEAPTIIQTLIFPQYVVTEVHRRMERKLGLKAFRNDGDIAWAVQRRLPLTAISDR